MALTSDIYAGRDARLVPAYGIPEVARYLGLPYSTLRAWSLGHSYSYKGDERRAQPVLRLERGQQDLSFINLVEAHVLSAIRREHEIPLQKVRLALRYLAKAFPNLKHPLAQHAFQTDGIDLFVEHLGLLINASREGQTAMRQVLAEYLARIERDATGLASRLYPFTRGGRLDDPKSIMIDPLVSFGRPVLSGTAIPTAVIGERIRAGESIAALAEDYHRSPADIEEAIRCELRAA